MEELSGDENTVGTILVFLLRLGKMVWEKKATAKIASISAELSGLKIHPDRHLQFV